MSWMPLLLCWAILAITVIGLAFYRKFVARNEDDFLHVANANNEVLGNQTALAHRLESIDRWGKMLTVVLVVATVLLAGVFLFNAWQESNQLVK